MNAQTVVTEPAAVGPSFFKRISWGAIFAGLIITLVAQMTLTLLGAAIGAASINPTQENVRALGMGASIWLVVTSLVSIYIGSCVAGRLSGGPNRADGMLHGFVTWGTATLVATLLLTTAIGALFGGAISLVSRSFAMAVSHEMGDAPMVSGTIQGSAFGEVPEIASFSAKDPQLGAALARMFSHGGAQQSPSDRDAVVNLLVTKHGMTQEQAASTVDRWSQQYQQVRTEAEQKGREIGEKTVHGVSKGALWGFLALVLGAAVSAWGGWSGAASLLKDEPVVAAVGP
jgi:hypothetical protein